MVRVKFKSEIWKSGNSYVVTIPKQYVKDGWLRTGQGYEFVTETQEQNEKEAAVASQTPPGPNS